MKKYGLHILIAVFIIMQLPTFIIDFNNSVPIRDTIFSIKTIKEVSNEFSRVPQQPIINIKNYTTTNNNEYKKLIKQLEDKYSKQADSTIILRELLQAKQQKVYKESFKDSIIKADVTAYVTDKLDSLSFKYTRLPFTYKEKTIYVSPRFKILAGLDVIVKKDKMILGANIGFKNSSNIYYNLSAFTDKSIMIGAKFEL